MKNNHMKKRFLFLFLALAVCFSSLTPMNALASTGTFTDERFQGEYTTENLHAILEAYDLNDGWYWVTQAGVDQDYHGHPDTPGWTQTTEKMLGQSFYYSPGWYGCRWNLDQVYAPIPNSDGWGECFGFVGCAAVLLMYLFLILRMIFMARFTEDKFCQLVIIGVVSALLFHVFQNVAMSMGIMPITGIPLPFLSYGGSNFISNIAAIALVLNIARSGNAVTSSVPLPILNSGQDIGQAVQRRGLRRLFTRRKAASKSPGIRFR